jgi:hypothetical protein
VDFPFSAPPDMQLLQIDKEGPQRGTRLRRVRPPLALSLALAMVHLLIQRC